MHSCEPCVGAVAAVGLVRAASQNIRPELCMRRVASNTCPGGGLLTAALRRGAEEEAAGLADQRARLPQLPGAVPEGLELRRRRPVPAPGVGGQHAASCALHCACQADSGIRYLHLCSHEQDMELCSMQPSTAALSEQ